MIKTHTRTKQRLLLIKSNKAVSTLFVLDSNDKKIKQTTSNGKVLLDVHGEPRYQLAICLNKNLK